MPHALSADAFVKDLSAHASSEEAAKRRRHDVGEGVIGVRMGTVFEPAKAYAAMPLGQIDASLGHPAYEARMGAVSVMDEQARRTALVATASYLKQGEVEDTYAIAELLLDDPTGSTQKAVGSWLREPGKRDPARPIAFLDKHAARMSRLALRTARERWDAEARRRLREAASGV
jgi:hypothetical protein